MGVYSAENLAFHGLIRDMAASDIVRREIDRITSLPFASPSAFIEDETHPAHLRNTLMVAQEQHRGILQAIRNRESGRAEFLTREHARTARRNVRRLIADPANRREGAAALALVSP